MLQSAFRGTLWRRWLRHCATRRKSRVWFPVKSLELFIDLILPAALQPCSVVWKSWNRESAGASGDCQGLYRDSFYNLHFNDKKNFTFMQTTIRLIACCMPHGALNKHRMVSQRVINSELSFLYPRFKCLLGHQQSRTRFVVVLFSLSGHSLLPQSTTWFLRCKSFLIYLSLPNLTFYGACSERLTSPSRVPQAT